MNPVNAGDAVLEVAPEHERSVKIKTRIKERRLALGLSQHQAAYKAGYSQTAWAQWESVKLFWHFPNPDALYRMALALDTTPKDLGA